MVLYVFVNTDALSFNYRGLLVSEGPGTWKPPDNEVPVSDGAKEINTGMIMSKSAWILGIEVGSIGMYKRLLHTMEVHKIKLIINKAFLFELTLKSFAYLHPRNHFAKICIRF